jgi:hypothetical protein
MFRQCLKSAFVKRSFITPRISTSNACYLKKPLQFQKLPSIIPTSIASQARSFHASRPSKIPIFSIPPIVLALLKTGKLVNILSISSKVSLTLLPHTYRSGKMNITAFLVGIPLVGFAGLAVLGMDRVRDTKKSI